MTSLQNGNYNSRSMNGLTTINANDINCDVINTIDANVANKLKVGVEAEMDGTLSVAGVTTAAQINATGLNVSGNADILGSLDVSGNVDISGNLTVVGTTNANQINGTGLNISGNADVLGSLDVSGNVDISGNLAVVGITDTTRLQADNLIIGGATYNAAVQFKMDGVANLGNRVNLNNQSRIFNIRDTNGLISIGRFSASEPGFELRNYDPTTNVLRTDVLFLGGGASEQMRATFRSPGTSDYVAWFSYRSLFDFRTPIKSETDVALTGTSYTARFRDRFATTASDLDIVLNPNTNDFSSIVQAGDNVVVASVAGKTLTLTTNNTSGCGIRMNSTISVGGATTFSNLITASAGMTANAGILANSGITIAAGIGGVSTGLFKSGGDLRMDGNQANSRIVIRNRDSGGVDYATCVLATTENRFIAGEFTFRNLTATTGDAYFRMTTDTNNIFIEPRAIGSNTLKNLRFITPGGTTAHLGIDSVDGSIVIATNTPATGCKLTINGKTQTIDLDVSGNLAVTGTITNAATPPASNDSSTRVPTTQWVQSAISANNSTITMIYTASQTITTPSNCRSVDITIVARGGDCGALYVGPPVYYGGSGAGGNMLTGSGIMIGQSQSLVLTIDNTNGTGSYYITYNSVIIARAYNGNKGGDAGAGFHGAGGTANTTASVTDTSYGNWVTAIGRAGTAGTNNGPSVASPNMCPKNISNWNANYYGCGRRLTTDPPTPTGYIMITYHCA